MKRSAVQDRVVNVWCTKSDQLNCYWWTSW